MTPETNSYVEHKSWRNFHKNEIYFWDIFTDCAGFHPLRPSSKELHGIANKFQKIASLIYFDSFRMIYGIAIKLIWFTGHRFSSLQAICIENVMIRFRI